MATLSEGLYPLGRWERLTLVVQACVQVLPGLEEGDHLRRDFNGGSRTWIPARASLAMLEREGAKASDFDAIFPGKCSPDRREDGFDDALDIAVLKMWVQLRHPSHQFRLCHSVPRLAAPQRKVRRQPPDASHLIDIHDFLKLNGSIYGG